MLVAYFALSLYRVSSVVFFNLSFSVCLVSRGESVKLKHSSVKSSEKHNLGDSRDRGSHGLNVERALLQKLIWRTANVHLKKNHPNDKW